MTELLNDGVNWVAAVVAASKIRAFLGIHAPVFVP